MEITIPQLSYRPALKVKQRLNSINLFTILLKEKMGNELHALAIKTKEE